MPMLGGCCFCFDLKVGTKIIGVLKLIEALLHSIMFAVMLVVLVIMKMGVDTSIALSSSISNSKSSTSTELPISDDDYQDPTMTLHETILEMFQKHIGFAKIVLYISLAMALLLIITTSMLIHGIKQNRRGLLLPYLVQETVSIILSIALAIALFVIFGSINIVVYMSLSIAVSILINFYFILVVISQHQALGLIQLHEEISMK